MKVWSLIFGNIDFRLLKSFEETLNALKLLQKDKALEASQSFDVQNWTLVFVLFEISPAVVRATKGHY